MGHPSYTGFGGPKAVDSQGRLFLFWRDRQRCCWYRGIWYAEQTLRQAP